MTDSVILMLDGLVAAHPGAAIMTAVITGAVLGALTAMVNGRKR